MLTNKYILKRAGTQIAVAAAAAFILGFMNLLGLLGLTGIVLFLAGTLMVTLFKKVYHSLVLFGIVLMSCVFVEPSPSDVIFCAVILLGLLNGTLSRRIIKKEAYAAGLLLVYFIACLPGIACSSDTSSVIRYFAITFFLFLLSVFIYLYTQRSNVLSIQRAYVLAACLSFAAGLLGYLGLFSELMMADAFRVRGLFKDANVFGPFFIPAIIILWDDMKRKAIWKASGISHMAIIGLLSLGVIFSFSRAAWINLAVACAVYALLHLRGIRPQKLLLIALAAGAAFTLVFVLFFSSALQSVEAINFLRYRAQLQDYDTNRFDAQKGGLELILWRPLGVGPGQFENEITNVTGMRLSSHSLYIRTFAENGIIGGVAFFSSIILVLLMLFSMHRAAPRKGGGGVSPGEDPQNEAEIAKPRDHGISPAVLIAVLSGILVNSLVIDTLHWRHLWFFIGLALYRIRENDLGEKR